MRMEKRRSERTLNEGRADSVQLGVLNVMAPNILETWLLNYEKLTLRLSKRR